jgi:hypothetical protein
MRIYVMGTSVTQSAVQFQTPSITGRLVTQARIENDEEQAAGAVRSSEDALHTVEQASKESLPRILSAIDWLKQQAAH